MLWVVWCVVGGVVLWGGVVGGVVWCCGWGGVVGGVVLAGGVVGGVGWYCGWGGR